MTELPFLEAVPDPTRPARPPAKCRRHDWVRMVEDHDLVAHLATESCVPTCVTYTACLRCGRMKDESAAKRGRTNRSRGNSIEREVGKQLGLRRVGQFGGPEDLTNAMWAAQVKSGGAFSERYWSWLRAVPVNAGQTPLLVVTDAPGPGHRRRAVVVLDLSDWIALHGPTEGEAL